MLDTLITSRTRIKLLLKFFSNTSNSAYLRSLAEEFGESTNSVRVELNRLSQAGLLQSEPAGNTVLYKANENNPLFPELKIIVSKYLGFDHIIEQVIMKLGTIDLALITGGYAEGMDNGIIDLVLVGEINQHSLLSYINKTEELINRKVRSLILSPEEYRKHKENLTENPHILLWGQLN